MLMLVKLVIPVVASHWDTLAYALDLEKAKVDIIKRNHPNNMEECCEEMLAHWLATKGTSRKTWQVLLDALKNIDLIADSENIEMKLKHT